MALPNRLWLPDGGQDLPVFPVERVVDATGAGDLFAAGFLFGLTSGREARDSLRLGALAAARTGKRVILADEGAEPGGALLHDTTSEIDGRPAAQWLAETLADLAHDALDLHQLLLRHDAAELRRRLAPVGVLRRQQGDLAFVATTEHVAAANPVPLGRRPVVLLVPPEHPLAARSSVAWSDLRDEEFIDFRETWGVRSLNDAACAARGALCRSLPASP